MKHATRSKRARAASYVGQSRRKNGTRNVTHEHVMTTTVMKRNRYRQKCRTCPKMTKWMTRGLPIALVNPNNFVPSSTPQMVVSPSPVVGIEFLMVEDAALEAYREARAARLSAHSVKDLRELCTSAGLPFKARDTKPMLIQALVDQGAKEFPAKMAALSTVTPSDGVTSTAV